MPYGEINPIPSIKLSTLSFLGLGYVTYCRMPLQN